MARAGANRLLRSVSIEPDVLHKVQDYVEAVPDKFLHCRTRQHAWTDHTVTQYNNAYVVKHRCTRCGCKKVFHVDSAGILIGSNQYEYPEGYALTGIGNLRMEGRGVVRLASITRGKHITVVNEDWE